MGPTCAARHVGFAIGRFQQLAHQTVQQTAGRTGGAPHTPSPWGGGGGGGRGDSMKVGVCNFFSEDTDPAIVRCATEGLDAAAMYVEGCKIPHFKTVYFKTYNFKISDTIELRR